VLAVSVDAPEESRKMAAELGLEYTLLSDGDLSAIDAWGVRHAGGYPGGRDIARPATFLIDAEGRVRWRELTDNWRVRLRPERVIEQLDALP
jgi:peroxiredoxin